MFGMPTWLFPWLVRGAVVLGIVIAAGAVYHHIWDNGYAKGRAEVRAKEVEPLKAQIVAAEKRSDYLASLYADQLPKIVSAARQQEQTDNVQITALQSRIEGLSHAPTLHFSSGAVSLWDATSKLANSGNAATTGGATGGAAAVPEQASPDATYSEADVVHYDALAGVAYKVALTWFHECRNLYNSARDSQIKAGKAGVVAPAPPDHPT